MGRSRFVAALLVGLAASSCTTWEERFERLQHGMDHELATLYPPGQRFWPTECAFFGPFKRRDLDDEHASRFYRWLRKRVRQHNSQAVACWHGFAPRWSGASIQLMPGIWADYVFVDADERILVAYRRFID